MKLEDIGFYTLENERAKNVTKHTPLWRCELILTDRCNFNCPYCMGIENKFARDITLDQAKHIVDLWADGGLKNIRFSGGEPTIWDGLIDLVKYTKQKGIERIAISTNGSAMREYYHALIQAGVDDVSVSLDACCDTTGDMMAGRKGMYQRVINNIKLLSQLTYVTAGVVLTEENIGELDKIIKMASNELGVADIRIITAAQWDASFRRINIGSELLSKHPILKYRVINFRNRRHIRGLSCDDNNKCPLVLDDMAISNNYHFPCIIYMRQHGTPIGEINGDINKIRKVRQDWYETTNTHKDSICNRTCLDVCIDYNNKVKELKS